MAPTSSQFALLSDVVRRRSGLALTPAKAARLNGKLMPVAARFGFKTVHAMLEELADEPEELAAAVTEAMTINETSFFRDPACFTHFREVILPALKSARAKTRRLRIWCAAASNGQEPYSLAILLDEEKLVQKGWKIDLFATDISSQAVERIREGVYSQYEVERGLTQDEIERYFVRDGENWRIAERLRRMLRLRPFNLLDHYGWLGTLDVVFCRNVLIYFDHQSKLEVVTRLEHALAPDGWLALGATENPAASGNFFAAASDARGVYRKVGAVSVRPIRLAG